MQCRRVPLHGQDGRLNDVRVLADDLAHWFQIASWAVQLEWAPGVPGDTESLVYPNAGRYAVRELRSLYESVYQTIDGVLE